MRRVVAVFSALGVLSGAPGAAAELPLVRLTLEGCDHVSQAEVRRIFSAELGSSATDVGGPDVTEVTVACIADHVRVRVRDPLSKKVVQRSFDSTSIDHRSEPRLFAIAASELVLASWAELTSNPAPVVAGEGQTPSLSATEAARARVRERSLASIDERHLEESDKPEEEEEQETLVRALGLASVRSFFEGQGTLWGGGARIGEERFRFMSWSVDTLVERGRVSGYAVTTATLGAWLLAHQRLDPMIFRLGAGLRAGVIGSATSDGSASALAPWGWPLAVVAISAHGGGIIADLSGEAGYVVMPLRGRQSEITVRGAWFSAQLGLGVVL